eukprot:g12045.t1
MHAASKVSFAKDWCREASAGEQDEEQKPSAPLEDVPVETEQRKKPRLKRKRSGKGSEAEKPDYPGNTMSP